MGIVEDDIRQVRERTQILDLIGEYTEVRKTGRSHKALCPFHSEKSPSLSINPELGLYHCFGCQAQGDVITFVQEIEHLDFASTVEKLASRIGITLRYDTNQSPEKQKRRDDLIDVMRQAVAVYHAILKKTPEALEYLTGRGITEAEIDRFQIGYAPKSGKAMNKVDAPADLLVDAGLIYRNKDGEPGSDVFKDRIMFPIFNTTGDPIAFGGRAFPRFTKDGRDITDSRKYRNSEAGPLYDKSRTLYGLNWAKTDAARRDEVFVVEGYFDAVAAAAVGYTNVVATCGTALTEQHARMLQRYASRITLGFDGDSAGMKAADAFYQWEEALGFTTMCVVYPDITENRPNPETGEIEPVTVKPDAGELLVRDPDALKAAFADPIRLIDYRMRMRLENVDPQTAIQDRRDEALDILDEVVRPVPSALIRHEYVNQVAAAFALPVPELLRDFEDPSRRNRATPTPTSKPRTDPSQDVPDEIVDTPETEAVRVLFTNRDQIAHVLEDWMFTEPLTLKVFRYLHAADPDALPGELIGKADPDVAALLRHLAHIETPTQTGTQAWSRLLERGLARYSEEVRQLALQTRDPVALNEIGQAQLFIDLLRTGNHTLDDLQEAHRVLRDWWTEPALPATAPPVPARSDPYDGYDPEAGW